MSSRLITLLPLVAFLAAAAATVPAPPDGVAEVPGPAASPGGGAATDAALLALGEQVYEEGILADGSPLLAVVQGDVPIQGTQFNCRSCHRRSGLGSGEGLIVAPPVNAPALYRPRDRGSNRRPAYTDESLALALRDGIDPTGKAFDPLMPRYVLPEREMHALIAYLRTLSDAVSPGVTDEHLRFATIVAGDADPTSMLQVLERFVEDKNRGTRNETRRSSHGPWYRENRNSPYRKWSLDVWRLTGPPEEWRRQLEQQYAERPVFAVLSGVGPGSWEPIHRFCEEHRVPCLLPNTDLPVADDASGYYTVYLSAGLYVEARVAARHLAGARVGGPVVQLFREGAPGARAARELRRALAANGSEAEVVDREIPRGTAARPVLENLPAAGALVAWLAAEDFPALQAALTGRAANAAPPVYVSSSLAGGFLSDVPEALRAKAHVLHRFSLPEEYAGRSVRPLRWLRGRGVPEGDARIQTQTYFACMVAHASLKHVRYDYFYRDFFLESMDHLTGTTQFSATHARASFGPGQRFLSKGCYVVPPTASGGEPRWVVP